MGHGEISILLNFLRLIPPSHTIMFTVNFILNYNKHYYSTFAVVVHHPMHLANEWIAHTVPRPPSNSLYVLSMNGLLIVLAIIIQGFIHLLPNEWVARCHIHITYPRHINVKHSCRESDMISNMENISLPTSYFAKNDLLVSNTSMV